MSESSKKLLQAAAGAAGGEALAIEDVFSTYLYTGNGTSQTITNGIDLAGEGGLVWIKSRASSNYGSHYLRTFNPNSGKLDSAWDGAQNNFHGSITTLNNGFQLTGDSNSVNQSGVPHVSWTFRKAPRFFDCVTWTGDGVNGRNIAHSLGSTIGTVILKRTDGVRDWFVWHRSAGITINSEALYLNATTPFQNTGTNAWGPLNGSPLMTPTTFSVGDDSNASGATYVAYLFAHDPLGPSGDGSDGFIECGSFLCGTFGGTASLPFSEAQWALVKNATGVGHWFIVDNMRGLYYNATDAAGLLANTTDYEQTRNIDMGQVSTSNGELRIFGGDDSPGDTYIYIAIRRGPMRAPTSGTDVYYYATQDAVSPGHEAPVPNWPVDFAIKTKTSGVDNRRAATRLLGAGFLVTNTTDAFVGNADYRFDYQNGFFESAAAFSDRFAWMFRRAPEFFDAVAYSGDGVAGRTVPHNLGVAPEMGIFKVRNNSQYNWNVYLASLGTSNGVTVNSNNASSGGLGGLLFNNTAPTSSEITLGDWAAINAAGNNYIAYLFATLPGISKVGSFTISGSDITVDCGFSSGARFVLIKRSSGTDDWYVFDTVRGYVSGSGDAALKLNSTAAESSLNMIEPHASGFSLRAAAWYNGDYIFYAIA